MRSATVNISVVVLLGLINVGLVHAGDSTPKDRARVGASVLAVQAAPSNLNWTVVGAGQPRIEPNTNGTLWSVGDKSHEVLVVLEPISDSKILPKSDPVPNTDPEKALSVVAAKGEYEPASFVIRAGAVALDDVSIDVADLVAGEKGPRFKRENVGLRLAKNWYQSADRLWRERGDTNVLTPELLLHDTNLVRVDAARKVNLIRDLRRIKDSARLEPFAVPMRTNQQIWLTTFIPIDAAPGKYQSEVVIRFRVGDRRLSDRLSLTVTVLPFTLPDPVIDYALFYTSHLVRGGRPSVNAAEKTEAQMLADFVLMREYGFTNVAIDHKFQWKPANQADLDDLAVVMTLLRKAGFKTKQFLYVDWKVTDSHNDSLYVEKIDQLRNLAAEHGFTELYVYNQDEKSPNELLAEKESMITTHARGAKSFVATKAESIGGLKGLLDVAILNRKFSGELKKVRAAGITPWAYDSPQAGDEKPGTYRNVYGITLWLDGFDGACAYAYQTGSPRDASGWDDWGSDRWRPHVLAYPTLTTPIPTLQLEGWREAIDDMRYLTLLLQRVSVVGPAINRTDRFRQTEEALGQQLSENAAVRRRQIIDALLRMRVAR